MDFEMPANNNNKLRNMAMPFMLDRSGIRGHVVRLGETAHTILSNHKYPLCTSQLLGEMLVLVTMIAAILKPKGMVTIQAQGDGALRFLSADHTPEGHLRGYAHINDRPFLQNLPETERHDLRKIFGKGVLVITIENIGERPYQAIVPLEGHSLPLCVADYFRRTGQLDVEIEVSAEKLNRQWHAGGVILQRLPGEDDENEDHWNRACIMLKSVTDRELINDNLPPHTLLYRLFNEDGVRVFEEQNLIARCRCSRERMQAALMNLSAQEREELAIKGVITMTCHFCNKREKFDRDGGESA